MGFLRKGTWISVINDWVEGRRQRYTLIAAPRATCTTIFIRDDVPSLKIHRHHPLTNLEQFQLSITLRRIHLSLLCSGKSLIPQQLTRKEGF